MQGAQCIIHTHTHSMPYICRGRTVCVNINTFHHILISLPHSGGAGAAGVGKMYSGPCAVRFNFTMKSCTIHPAKVGQVLPNMPMRPARHAKASTPKYGTRRKATGLILRRLGGPRA
ncbi:hypothetical protein FKM82_028782 [Ascaphus truei]